MQYKENDIKRYIDGEMSEVERKDFELKLEGDEALALQVDIEQELFEHFSTGENILQHKLNSLNKEHFKEEKTKVNKKWFLLMIPLFLFFSFWYYADLNSDTTTSVVTETEIPIPNQEEELVTPPTPQPTEKIPTIQENINPTPQPKPPTIQEEEIQEEVINQPIAAIDPSLYESNENIESLLGEAVRSSKSKLKLTTPLNDQNFELSEEGFVPLNIEVITNSADEIVINIYDNKALNFQKNLPVLRLSLKPALNKEEKYVITHKANIPFQKGLYYLLIQVKDELSYDHISRFYVR